MSKRERAKQIIDILPEEKVDRILFFLMGVQYDSDLDDDLFCEKLIEDYLIDDSPDKHDTISIEALAAREGVVLK